MTDAEEVRYVYAVVEASATLDGVPAGIDDVAVEAIVEQDVAALTCALDAAGYASSEIEARTADFEWLGPRARAHDLVITAAGERNAVVPLPMFSLFRDAESVRRMLRERRSQLVELLDRVRDREEYAVRLFRIDDALASHLSDLSPRIAQLERSAASASPGQRYLLRRKLEAERSEELRRIGADVAQRAHDALAEHAAASVLDPLPRRTPEGMAGTAVLNASYLLPRADTEPFRRALTALIDKYEARGFRFEFTGPWPPYHFVREATDER